MRPCRQRCCPHREITEVVVRTTTPKQPSVAETAGLDQLRPSRRSRTLADELAHARCLQQPQTVACDLLRTQVALPLVVELEARPCLRIHGLEVGSAKLAVGRRLRCEQRAGGPANSIFRVSIGRRGSLDRSSLDRICLSFALSRIGGATANRHRARYRGQGQKPWRERWRHKPQRCSARCLSASDHPAECNRCEKCKATTLQLRRCHFEKTVSPKRSSGGRHAHASPLISRRVPASAVERSSQCELREAMTRGPLAQRADDGCKT